jgi:hypothetical protein
VNYYLTDIELLFSRNPFVQQYGSRFSNIRPNLTQTVDLPKDKPQVTFDLPQKLHNSNVLVEIIGRGMKKTAAYYSNSLTLQLIENYGQVHCTQFSQRGQSDPCTYANVENTCRRWERSMNGVPEMQRCIQAEARFALVLRAAKLTLVAACQTHVNVPSIAGPDRITSPTAASRHAHSQNPRISS